MTIWLISDTHLFHANFLKFRSEEGHQIRPFASVEEMNECMCDHWAQTVKVGDHVYHLGDVALQCSSLQCAEVIKKLPGHKRLVRGNHDRFKTMQYVRMGFEEIHGMHCVGNVWVSHAPLHPDSLGSKRLGNAHGHIHERPSPPGRYVNMCVERWNYTPVSIDSVRTLLEEKGVDNAQGLE